MKGDGGKYEMTMKRPSLEGNPSQHDVILVKNPLTPDVIAAQERALAAHERALAAPLPPNGFIRWFEAQGIETWASEVLEKTGLPADRELLEAAGKDKDSIGWLAAELLRLSRLVKGFVLTGEAGYVALYAIELGELLEGGKWYFDRKAYSKKGGARPKRPDEKAGLSAFIVEWQKSNPGKAPSSLWAKIRREGMKTFNGKDLSICNEELCIDNVARFKFDGFAKIFYHLKKGRT